jgi:hypothetical protein
MCVEKTAESSTHAILDGVILVIDKSENFFSLSLSEALFHKLKEVIVWAGKSGVIFTRFVSVSTNVSRNF